MDDAHDRGFGRVGQPLRTVNDFANAPDREQERADDERHAGIDHEIVPDHLTALAESDRPGIVPATVTGSPCFAIPAMSARLR